MSAAEELAQALVDWVATATQLDPDKDELPNVEDWQRNAKKLFALELRRVAKLIDVGDAMADLIERVGDNRKDAHLLEWWAEAKRNGTRLDAFEAGVTAERDEARALYETDVSEARAMFDQIAEEHYVGCAPRLSETIAERDAARAEVDMLRGVGCGEDGDGPCGACLKCSRAELADARSAWAVLEASWPGWRAHADASATLRRLLGGAK